MKTFAPVLAEAARLPGQHAQAQPDQRPAAVAQRQVLAAIANSPRQVAQRQQQPNRTGLPDKLKAGVESLSGHSFDDVQVHYNSARPAQLQAHAYAQGTDIHLAPGQEKHLPHEAWHVAQQKQGRVRPTTQLKGVGVNDDNGLEVEATRMGAQALQKPEATRTTRPAATPAGPVPVQLAPGDEDKKKKKVTGKRTRRQAREGSSSESESPSEEDATQQAAYTSFSTRDSNVGERRVHTTLPEIAQNQESTNLQKRVLEKRNSAKQGRRKKTKTTAEADFSYEDLAIATHQTLDANELTPDAQQRAIKAGTTLPLQPGTHTLNANLNRDLQQVPHHILRYQNFHTPPNLKGRSKKREAQQKTQQENRFRQRQLNNTKEWLEQQGGEGLKRMLPKPPPGGHTRLRNIFPGPIDIGFPPNEKQTILGYDNVKGVFKLHKQAQLDAFRKQEATAAKRSKKPKKASELPSDRRILTDSLLQQLEEQDLNDGLTGEQQLRRVGLKRSDSMESLDEATSDEETERTSKYNPKDTLKKANRKRHTLATTLGLVTKATNHKLMQDHQRLLSPNAEEKAAAEKSRQRHERVLARLQGKADKAQQNSGTRYTGIKRRWQNYEKKRVLLKKQPEESQRTKRWQKYKSNLKAYGKSEPVGDLLKQKHVSPLNRIGKATIEKEIAEEQKLEQEKRKTKRKQTSKTKRQRLNIDSEEET